MLSETEKFLVMRARKIAAYLGISDYFSGMTFKMKDHLASIEKELIAEALAKTKNNADAARLLGMTRTALQNKRKMYGFPMALGSRTPEYKALMAQMPRNLGRTRSRQWKRSKLKEGTE